MKPGSPDELFHHIDGAIVFQAAAKLRHPYADNAFWPIDWEFATKSKETRLRLTLQYWIEHGFVMKFWTGHNKAIELYKEGKTSPLINLIQKTAKYPDILEGEMHTIAITFKSEKSGWTTMSLYVVPDGGNIYPWSKPLMAMKFRVHAEKVDWNGSALTASSATFGIRFPKEEKTDYIDLDELRFFDKYPCFIRGKP